MIGEDKYLVVAMVMSVIFIGLGVYLYLIDKKISRLEKNQENKTGLNKK